jgi:hypothetical protein
MADALLKALSPISAYAARQTTLWDDLTDRIAGAILQADLDDFEVWLDCYELRVPSGWMEPLQELVEKRREALHEEDISQIMRDRFDF